jgi:hypothetical protein
MAVIAIKPIRGDTTKKHQEQSPEGYVVEPKIFFPT